MKVYQLLSEEKMGTNETILTFNLTFDIWHVFPSDPSRLVKIKQIEPLLLSPSIPDLYLSQTAPESLNESPAAPLSRQERDNLNHLARNLVDPSVEGEEGLQEGDYSQF